jgi:hypothetical protein
VQIGFANIIMLTFVRFYHGPKGIPKENTRILGSWNNPSIPILKLISLWVSCGFALAGTDIVH